MTVLGPDALLAPLHVALKASGLDEADLWVHRRRAAVTRYSHSSIHQNAVSDETHVHARAIVGSAIGTTSGQLARGRARCATCLPARRAWRRCRRRTRIGRASRRRRTIASPSRSTRRPAPRRGGSGEARSGASARPSTAAGFRAAGTHSVDVTEDAVANTNGVAAYAPATVAYLRALVLGEHGGSGYADDLSHRASRARSRGHREPRHREVRAGPGSHPAAARRLRGGVRGGRRRRDPADHVDHRSLRAGGARGPLVPRRRDRSAGHRSEVHAARRRAPSGPARHPVRPGGHPEAAGHARRAGRRDRARSTTAGRPRPRAPRRPGTPRIRAGTGTAATPEIW